MIVLPAVGFAVAPIFDSPEERWESVGPVSRFTADTYKPVVFTLVEGIGEAGKTTAYVRRGDPDTFSDESAGTYIALSTRCAHLGCPVRFVSAAGNFICPCHGGVYDFEGKVIGGPPVRPLDRFQTRVRGRPGAARPPLQRHLAARPGSLPRPRASSRAGSGTSSIRRGPQPRRRRSRGLR